MQNQHQVPWFAITIAIVFIILAAVFVGNIYYQSSKDDGAILVTPCGLSSQWKLLGSSRAARDKYPDRVAVQGKVIYISSPASGDLMLKLAGCDGTEDMSATLIFPGGGKLVQDGLVEYGEEVLATCRVDDINPFSTRLMSCRNAMTK